MALDITSFASALKHVYSDEKVENLVYKDNPFMAMVAKNEDFTGDQMAEAIIWGNPQGASADFPTAQAASLTTSSKISAFQLTRVNHYSLATISGEALEASVDKTGAFMKAAVVEVDGAINALKRKIATSLFRSGYGTLGTVVANAGSTVTVSLPDANNFEIGQSVVFAGSEATGNLRVGGSLLITNINRNTGVITFSTAVSNITSLTNGDTIFAKGDRQDASSPVRLMPAGLEAWVGQSDPTSTPFFGVDRSVDTIRLGGIHYDGSAISVEEALIEGANAAATVGAKIDTYFISFRKYTDLVKSLMGKVQYVNLKADTNAQISFRGVVLQGANGEINVVPDINCPSNRAFGVQLDTWSLNTLGKAFKVIDADGLPSLRQNSADGIEVRYVFRGNLSCKAPGWNVNVAL